LTRRALAAYTGGFLFDRRIRRILDLAGWDLWAGLRPASCDAVAVWGRRPVSWRALAVSRRFGVPLLNVEDAFLRSVRPGPAGEPPIGLLLDARALHYDAARPSELEARIAAHPALTEVQMTRARDGIALLRDAGLSKYSDWLPEAAPPAPGYVLVIDQTRGDAAITHAGADMGSFARMLSAARAEHPAARIVLRTHPVTAAGHRKGHFGPGDIDSHTEICAAPVNPWALLSGARAVYCVSSQLGFEAMLAGHRPVVFSQPFYAGWGLSDDRALIPRRTARPSVEALFHAAMIEYPVWYDPYRDQLGDFETAAHALAAQARAWRESRRAFVCAGMRPWKHKPVRDFLRGRTMPVFENRPQAAIRHAARTGRSVLLWAGKETPEIRDQAAAAQVPLWRVEDGFLRSVGLGANLLPAASLVLDDLGIYFDPTRPSRLEAMIAAAAPLPPGKRRRARALTATIVAARLTKYNVGADDGAAAIPAGVRCVLVPGQVEDDASIRLGTSEVRTNLELLRRARAHFPDAFIIYKPHPDVEVGLRAGAVPEAEAARLADRVARDLSAPAAMDMADVVWTMTSLMGFEALMRGKEVHCLGMPFYAGWGLTQDHGQSHPRRTARPDLDALVHAALVDYPRYFDARTGLACPAEVILDRLAERGGSVTRQATLRHKWVAVAQYRLRRLAPLWRRRN